MSEVKSGTSSVKNTTPQILSTRGSKNLSPIKTSSLQERAHNLTNNALQTILFGGYSAYDFATRTTPDAIKDHKNLEKLYQGSLKTFGLTTALSLVPNLTEILLEAYNIRHLKQDKADQTKRNQQKLQIVNDLIEIKKTHSSGKNRHDLKKHYQDLENQEKQEFENVKKNQKTTDRIKTGTQIIGASGGLITASHMIGIVKNHEALSKTLSVFNTDKIPLKSTQVGMGLLAVGIGISAASTMFNIGHKFFKDVTQKDAQKEIEKPSDTKINYSDMIKDRIIPATGQLLNGIGTATLLRQNAGWAANALFNQGGMYMNLGEGLTLSKAMLWGGALSSISGGAGALMGAGIAINNAYKKHNALKNQESNNQKEIIDTAMHKIKQNIKDKKTLSSIAH
ncbi:MAG: hypothetical protein ACJARD_000871 [Alphaproteobacteria bacterium]|jgi:hypothetical protein